MPEEGCIGRDPARYREVARTLRQIALQVRSDRDRADHLHALADGFDRLAQRLEWETLTEAAA